MSEWIAQKYLDEEIYLATNRILAECISRIKALGDPVCTSTRLEYPSDICGVLADYINPPALIEEVVADYHAEAAKPDPDYLRDRQMDERMMQEARL